MSKTASVVVIAAAAFGAGAVAGLLFAPASGDESRQKLLRQVKLQTASLDQQLKEFEKKLSALEKQVRESGQELSARVRSAASTAVDRILPEVPGDESWKMQSSDLAGDLPHMPKV